MRPIDCRRGDFVYTPLGHLAKVLSQRDDGKVELIYVKEPDVRARPVALAPALLRPWRGEEAAI